MRTDKTTPTVGKLLTGGERRDAVHFALAPVTAGQDLYRGQHVGLRDDGLAWNDNHIGIVDPFLEEDVKKGQRFWLFLYPGTITSLRHEWEHPAFPVERQPIKTDTSESEAWLRAYAVRMNCYDKPEQAFERLLDGLRIGDLRFRGSSVYSEESLAEAPDLKWHAERYLGIRIDWDQFFFSCTC